MGIDEDSEGGFIVQAAGVPEREYPFDPAAALFGATAKGSFPPEYGEADGSFRKVVGRFDALLLQKDKETLHFLVQQAGKLSRFVVTVAVEVDQFAEAGEEGIPLGPCGRFMGHFAQALQFITRPPAAGRELLVVSLGKRLGLADEVGKTGLAKVGPLAIDRVVVADEDAVPVADELVKGFLGTVGVDHEEGGQRVYHDPEPVEFSAVSPGGFVEVIDMGGTGLVADGFVVRENGGGGAVDELLDGAEADRDAKHGRAEGADRVTAIACDSRNFGDERGKPRPETIAEFMRDMPLANFSTGRAAAFVEDEMRHRQFAFGQLDILVGVVGLCSGEVSGAAGTRTREDIPGFGWRKQRVAVSLVSLLCSRLALLGRFGFVPSFFCGTGGGRWMAGGLKWKSRV